MTRRIVVLPDAAAVAAATADRVVAAARNAVRRRGIFRLVLSGGATPRPAYSLLRAPPRVEAVDWSRVEFFWADERAVPPDDHDSNYGAAVAGLLSRLPGVRPEAIHRMQAERAGLDKAAADYQAKIAGAFGLRPSHATPPAFDLVWLGMGRDGHTASLFPGSAALAERRRWVVGNWAPGPACWRMTLTYPILNAAREVIFQVCGPGKTEAFHAVQSAPRQTPAAAVRARRTVWLVDRVVAG